ncbi:MAG: hypothetical protein RLZZ408_1529 [Verrucomicrobiota bacterium]
MSHASQPFPVPRISRLPRLPWRGLLITALLGCSGAVTASDSQSEAWEKPRELEAFRKLIARSPFSLPTAEESSPLAERYAMTGIITIGGEEQVFVFDRTDQSRELLTGRPNAKNMSLVTLVREGKNPIKATIRVGGETGTIGFLEGSNPSAQAAPPAPGSPASANAPAAGVKLPPLPPLPKTPSNTPPGRRIIRRPVVTAPQTTQPPAP